MREENRALLGPADVVLATHPGSGTSWLATLLVNLGVFYASGEDELLLDASSQRTGGILDGRRQLPNATSAGSAPDHAIALGEQQRHLPDLRARDERNPSYREPLRVIKTNQSAVGWTTRTRVVLLVRDGRDAVLSLFHNLRNFGTLDVSLAEYLEGNDGAWPLPAMSWAFSTMSWVGALEAERLHVLKFESCRKQPLDEFRSLLRFLEVEREDAEIQRAIEESSYDRMRSRESAAIGREGDRIGRGRIMRRGLVGEWREVYTDEMLRTFRGLPERALAHFGYDSSP